MNLINKDRLQSATRNDWGFFKVFQLLRTKNVTMLDFFSFSYINNFFYKYLFINNI